MQRNEEEPKTHISQATTRTNLHSVTIAAVLYKCKLEIVDISVLQAFELNIDVPSSGIICDNFKSTTIDVGLSRLVRVQYFKKLLKGSLARFFIRRPLERWDACFWRIVNAISGAKTVGSYDECAVYGQK